MTTPRRLAYSALVFVLAAAAVEVGFHVYWAVRDWQRPSNVEYDHLCDFRLRPSRQGVFDSHGVEHPFRVNALAHRGAELPAARPAGGFRVACLGASTTFGFGVSADERTFPAVLEARLRAAAPGRPVEVLNAGVPAWNLRRTLDNYAARLARLGFDAAFVLHASNDLYEGTGPMGARYVARSLRPPGELPGGELTSRLLRASGVLRHAARRQLRRARYAAKRDAFAPEGLVAFERNLEALVALLRDGGTRAVLCTEPHLYPATEEEAYRLPFGMMLPGALRVTPLTYAGLRRGLDAYNDAVRDVARRAGADLLDLERLVPRDPALYVDYIHQNDEGARVLGELMAEHLLRTGELAR